MISSLLLPRDLECPAITTATNANFTLQLTVELLWTETKQVAPATILDDSFKLIDILASEGAVFAPYIFEDAFNRANKSSKFAVASQAMVHSMTIGDNSNGNVKPQKLIVIYSKRSLHFREDCGYFVRENGSNSSISMDTPASSTSSALSASSVSPASSASLASFASPTSSAS